MHDVSVMRSENRVPAPTHPARLRIVLDVRQSLSGWKQALFLAASLGVGLGISVAVLAVAGISPIQLAGELVGVFNAESLHAVLVQAAR